MKFYRGLETEIEKQLRNLEIQLGVASLLRTFPNGKNLNPRISKWLNVIGKDVEMLHYELGFILGGISLESYLEVSKDKDVGSRRLKLSPIPSLLDKDGELKEDE